MHAHDVDKPHYMHAHMWINLFCDIYMTVKNSSPNWLICLHIINGVCIAMY